MPSSEGTEVILQIFEEYSRKGSLDVSEGGILKLAQNLLNQSLVAFGLRRVGGKRYLAGGEHTAWGGAERPAGNVAMVAFSRGSRT